MSIRRRPAKDGSVSFYVYVRDHNGRSVYVGKRETKTDAKNLEAEERVRHRLVKEGRLEAAVVCRHTLESAYELVREGISTRSQKCYGQALRVRVFPRIGSVPLPKLNRETVRKMRDELLADGYSTNSVDNAITALSAVCKLCIEHKLMTDNPCKGAFLANRRKRKRLDARRRLKYFRTKEDVRRFVRACTDSGLRDLFSFLFCTGLRIGEAICLEWSDVDLERRLILVHRGEQGVTKSGEHRDVPILDELLPLLRRMATDAGAEGRPAAGLVFPSRRGTRRAQSAVRRSMGAALVRAGITDKLTPHSCRHTFAARWLEAGGDIFRLSRVLGHADVAETQDTYGHLIPDVWSQDYGRLTGLLPPDPRTPPPLRAVGDNGGTTDDRPVEKATDLAASG